jgi:hypothetical protein
MIAAPITLEEPERVAETEAEVLEALSDEADAMGYETLVITNAVVTEKALNCSFGRKLNIREIRRLEKNGLLFVQIEAQNLSAKELTFEYRFRWLDENGFVVESAPMRTWVQVQAAGKEIVFLKGMAPIPTATEYICDIRYIRKSTRWNFKPQKEKEQV